MRAPEYTAEQIVDAGRRLEASGKNVNGFTLRKELGGGNATRLKQVWEEHQATQATTEVVSVADLPVEVAEELNSLIGSLGERVASMAVELNDRAVKAAERRVREVVQSAGEQRVRIERELADASQAVEDLDSEIEQLTVRVAHLQDALAQADNERQELKVKNAHLLERNDALEQALSSSSKREDDLNNKLQAAHDAERNARTLMAQAQGAFEQAERQAEVDRKAIANLRSALNDALEKMHTANVQSESVRDQLKKATNELAEAREEARQSARAAAEAAGREQARESQIAALQEQVRALSAGQGTTASTPGTIQKTGIKPKPPKAGLVRKHGDQVE